MYKIFVLDTNKTVLSPCSPRRAKILLSEKKAAVFKRFPFTIILKKEIIKPELTNLRIKIDPGSKTSGLVLLDETKKEIIWSAEILHRSYGIKKSLQMRKMYRGHRRFRKTRYRQTRYLNRTKPKGWLPPSIASICFNIETWVTRIHKLTKFENVSIEWNRFDTQKMLNPEISGIEYQQGELQGYEIREYLLEKFKNTCVYCNKKEVLLQIEHVIPKSRGGTNKISNLVLACKKCNDLKKNKTAAEFGFPDIQKLVKPQLKDASVTQAIRNRLVNFLNFFNTEVETGTGALTKYNRVKRGLPKAHWIDAACVGLSTPEKLDINGIKPLFIAAKGHGKRQRSYADKYGFAKSHIPRKKFFLGFQTGDIVKAKIPTGKNKGTYTGRIVIRFRPGFILDRKIEVHPKYLKKLQKSDGYAYTYINSEAVN